MASSAAPVSTFCSCRAKKFSPLRKASEERSSTGEFVHDEGSGGEVAEALVLAVAQHRNYAREIEVGQDVDDAQQVSGKGFEERDLASAVLDDAELHQALAWSLSVPERFKECEVSRDEAEVEENDRGDDPFAGGIQFVRGLRDMRRCAAAGDETNQDRKQDISKELDEVIDQHRDKTAADSGDRKTQIYLLGRFDVKLVGIAVLLKLHDFEPLD